MDKTNEIIKELNDFLKGINMGIDVFTTYEEKVTDTYLKNEFSKIISIYDTQKKIIISYIEQLYGEPEDSLGVVGEIASIFEKLKDIFINDDKEFLDNAIKGINMGIEGGTKVISNLEKLDFNKDIIKNLNNMLNEYKAMSDQLSILYEK